jgi:hypothetical protein
MRRGPNRFWFANPNSINHFDSTGSGSPEWPSGVAPFSVHGPDGFRTGAPIDALGNSSGLIDTKIPVDDSGHFRGNNAFQLPLSSAGSAGPGIPADVDDRTVTDLMVRIFDTPAQETHHEFNGANSVTDVSGPHDPHGKNAWEHALDRVAGAISASVLNEFVAMPQHWGRQNAVGAPSVDASLAAGSAENIGMFASVPPNAGLFADENFCGCRQPAFQAMADPILPTPDGMRS